MRIQKTSVGVVQGGAQLCLLITYIKYQYILQKADSYVTYVDAKFTN